jgi:hypothetical protein
MCRTVFEASLTADLTASAKLTSEVPTIVIFLYVPGKFALLEAASLSGSLPARIPGPPFSSEHRGRKP